MLTPPEIARRLRVKPSRVRQWIMRGELRAANLGDGSRPRYKIDPADLQIFLEHRAAGPAPRPVRRRRRNPEITEYF